MEHAGRAISSIAQSVPMTVQNRFDGDEVAGTAFFRPRRRGADTTGATLSQCAGVVAKRSIGSLAGPRHMPSRLSLQRGERLTACRERETGRLRLRQAVM